MESESRLLDHDGLLKLVVLVVDSVLAGLAPRKAGRFGASRSEKNQRTNMVTIDCETHRVDKTETQALVETGGRLSFPHSFEG